MSHKSVYFISESWQLPQSWIFWAWLPNLVQ